MTGRPSGWEGWDDYAAFYDWENARTIGRRDVAFWRRILRPERAPVLELGCGTGRLLMPVARAGIRVVGIDRSDPMLARAVVRARNVSRHDRPPVVRGDIRALPYASHAFGAVFAPYGLLQSLLVDRDVAATLAEATRVLKPGGLFAVDLVPDLQSWAEYRRRVRLTGPTRGGRRVTLIESVRQDRRRGVTTFDEEFVERRGRTVHRHDSRCRFAPDPSSTSSGASRRPVSRSRPSGVTTAAAPGTRTRTCG